MRGIGCAPWGVGEERELAVAAIPPGYRIPTAGVWVAGRADTRSCTPGCARSTQAYRGALEGRRARATVMRDDPTTHDQRRSTLQVPQPRSTIALRPSQRRAAEHRAERDR